MGCRDRLHELMVTLYRERTAEAPAMPPTPRNLAAKAELGFGLTTLGLFGGTLLRSITENVTASSGDGIFNTLFLSTIGVLGAYGLSRAERRHEEGRSRFDAFGGVIAGTIGLVTALAVIH